MTFILVRPSFHDGGRISHYQIIAVWAFTSFQCVLFHDTLNFILQKETFNQRMVDDTTSFALGFGLL